MGTSNQNSYIFLAQPRLNFPEDCVITLHVCERVKRFGATVTSNGSLYAMGPLSYLSVTLVYCGQTVGWIKMPLGTVVGLGPGHSVLDVAQLPPTERGTAAVA